MLGLAIEGERAAVQVFPLRSGRMVDRYAFHLEGVAGQDESALIEAFCLEYYSAAAGDPAARRRAAGQRRGWRPWPST